MKKSEYKPCYMIDTSELSDDQSDYIHNDMEGRQVIHFDMAYDGDDAIVLSIISDLKAGGFDENDDIRFMFTD